jgi:hypothetical protein
MSILWVPRGNRNRSLLPINSILDAVYMVTIVSCPGSPQHDCGYHELTISEAIPEYLKNIFSGLSVSL